MGMCVYVCVCVCVMLPRRTKVARVWSDYGHFARDFFCDSIHDSISWGIQGGCPLQLTVLGLVCRVVKLSMWI